LPNAFANQPVLLDSFPRKLTVWHDPISGIDVPKDPTQNLTWRAGMLEMAEDDPDLQLDLYTACSQSLLFFLNAFAFTLRIFQPDEVTGKNVQAKNAHLPFVTWEVQDKHLLRIESAIDNGEDLLTDKSRDMGATWDHIAVYAHRLLFRSSETHLMISRKEDAVDQLDGRPSNYPNGPLADPGTLFGKLDYILSRLPSWMLPNFSRKKLHLVNTDTSCRVDGESANANAGSSDRRTSIFLDEMAKMDEGESIKRSTRDVTACRLPCSTPNGAGTAYSKWRMSGTIPVFILAWWEHPEKGLGRTTVYDEEVERWFITSPWYANEKELRSPKELAIEVDMDHVGSGDTFFEGVVIEQHKLMFAKPPLSKFNINFKKAVTDAEVPAVLQRRQLNKVSARPSVKGKWSCWAALPTGRLDQTKTYTVACDIGKGQGASNSTVTVMCNETRQKVMAYADANTPPYEFAKTVVAACLWVGGRDRPLLIWENNGDPGFDFGNQVVRTYQYPNIYFDRQVGTLSQKTGKRFGWRSSREQKAEALGILRRAYAHGQFTNPDEAALNEALQYITYDSGGIGPAVLVEETAEARKTHGDRVIADMLAVLAREGKGLRKPGAQPDAGGRSFKHRFDAHKKRRHAGKSDRFDFTAA